MFIDRKIKITLNDESVEFPCNLCKSSKECMGGVLCKMTEYISNRLPEVYFKLDQNQPNIIVKSDKDSVIKAQNVINRAIRLRNVNRNR